MITLLVACIAISQQGSSLLQQVIPNPTGRNGYEEYLMACDLIRNSDTATLATASPAMLEEIISSYESQHSAGKGDEELPSRRRYEMARKYRGYTVLQLRRESLKLGGRALDLLHRGNQKPVFDPRTKMDMDTLFPEYAVMRSLGRVAVAGAYVAFAEGRTKQGTQYLCDAMILGQNLTDGVLISRLVGVAIQSIALASFESHLPNLALPDALMVEDLAPKLILDPPAAVRSLQREYAFIASGLDSILDQDLSDLVGEEEVSESTRSFIARMTLADKRQVAELVRRKLSRQRELTLAMYRQPESTWTDPPAADGHAQGEIEVRSNEDLAERMVGSIVPVFSQIGTAEVRNRTQIRLLALAGSVIRFRWEHDRWPTNLVEAVGESRAFDPANGGKFHYEVQGSGFRVYSEGTKTTGEIALRYRRPASGSDHPTPP